MLKKIILIVVCTVFCIVEGCAKVPDRDGVKVAYKTNSELSTVRESVVTQESTTEMYDKIQLDEINKKIIRNSVNQRINCTIENSNGQKLVIDAAVQASECESISKYEYILDPPTEKLREKLFAEYFKERADDALYDGINDFWILKNSEEVGDYFLYDTTYFNSGETVSGEEGFCLEYRKVNLYPFDDNLLESTSKSLAKITIDEVISACNAHISAVTELEKYNVDYIHAYGNQGRRPYFRVVYKRVLDNLPVTSFNDIQFWVDDNGIQKIKGALYNVREIELEEPILSVVQTLECLKNNADLISFDTEELYVGSINLEYIVYNSLSGEAVITPAWRFCIGSTEEQMNIMRRNILAIDAVTGEIIQGERGNTF